MAHRRTTEPTVRPVVWEQLKAHLRLTDDSEQTYGEHLIDVATQWVEEHSNRALLTQTWQLTLDGFGDCKHVTNGVIYVPRSPLIAVSAITYLDTAGDSQTWGASNYRVVTSGHPGRIEEAYGIVYPTTRGVAGSVVITHTAGYGAAATSVPIGLRHAVLLLAGMYYQHRGDDMANKEVDFTIRNLVAPFTMEIYA